MSSVIDTEVLHEEKVTLDFHGKSTYTFKHTRSTVEGKVYENMFLIGARGAYYTLQSCDPYGKNPRLSGVYQPISLNGGPLTKKGNPMLLFIVGGIVSVFTDR